jgi:hypothetical protein
LRRSIAVSALLIAASLSLFEFSFVTQEVPSSPQILEISLPPAIRTPTQVESDESEEAKADEIATHGSDEPAGSEPPITAGPVAEAQETGQPVDWYTELERVSAELAAQDPAPNSVNPRFDELRRVARIRYRKPENDPPRPIWENVEKDYLGRSILRHGDCYRIIDDPAVGNRFAFETFQQFMVFCTYQASKPHDLPWVKEIQSRYTYLRREGDDVTAEP